MITAYATDKPYDHLALYQAFLDAETDASGTVVIHHGRVKRPGKQVPDFSAVELRPLSGQVDAQLAALARRAAERFGLNQVLVVHRLGRIGAGDPVLLAIVSSVTRDKSFEACRYIVDEIKKEEFIELVELP